MRIVISGTVGVGKSTTSRNVADYLLSKGKEVSLIDELVGDNPYLDKYYENRPEWSFLIQMDFLLSRYKTLIEENEKHHDNSERVTIYDRHFLDDMLFASMKTIKEDMSTFQFNQYKNTNIEMAARIQPEDQPDYYFLLKLDFDSVIERIRKRGRTSELEVDIDYWKDMYYQYYDNTEIRNYLEENTKNLIEIDITEMDEFEVRDALISRIKGL